MNFIVNKIKEGDETVAAKLRRAREQKSISLEEVAKKLNIKLEYLESLEKGEYEKLPGGIYEKTFLKKYAFWLKLDFNDLEKELSGEKKIINKIGEKNVFSKKRIKSREFLVFPKIIKNILITIIASVFFVYIGFYFRVSFSAPKIEIIEPIDNLITENNFVYVVGRTSARAEVTINGRRVLKNDSGEFKEKIDLKKGMNTVVISAQNKYSEKTEVEKQILVK